MMVSIRIDEILSIMRLGVGEWIAIHLGTAEKDVVFIVSIEGESVAPSWMYVASVSDDDCSGICDYFCGSSSTCGEEDGLCIVLRGH